MSNPSWPDRLRELARETDRSDLFGRREGEDLRAAADAFARLQEERDALLAVAESLEWVKDKNRDWRCEECRGYRPDEVLQPKSERGHRPTCRIGAAVALCRRELAG